MSKPNLIANIFNYQGSHYNHVYYECGNLKQITLADKFFFSKGQFQSLIPFMVIWQFINFWFL
jgi:hypothetical protein